MNINENNKNVLWQEEKELSGHIVTLSTPEWTTNLARLYTSVLVVVKLILTFLYWLFDHSIPQFTVCQRSYWIKQSNDVLVCPYSYILRLSCKSVWMFEQGTIFFTAFCKVRSSVTCTQIVPHNMLHYQAIQQFCRVTRAYCRIVSLHGIVIASIHSIMRDFSDVGTRL